jgi:serine/threonine protein kinase
VSVLQLNEVVGDRYTIEAEIGKGGMQEVYRAHDDILRRIVAVKVPQDSHAAKRFRDSAVIAAKVNHPNVAKTLDYFEDETNRPFLVEEYIDGMNLRDVMNQFERLDPHTAAHIMHHLARGLSASHHVGVVHRDLKPSNVMVRGGLEFQALRLTDFGIARMAQEEIDSAVAGGDETTKKSTTVMNALAYLAPEIVQASHTISKPADVWAIAAMTWEILTGKPPFGTGLKAVGQIISDARPTLPAYIAGHPQFGRLASELAEVIMTCLRPKPEKRPSADDLIAICDRLCYLPVIRETGTVGNYPASSFGFINADSGDQVFFHTQNVIKNGPRPPIGTRVWFTRFDGDPRPRAIPVVPLRAQT